MKNKAKEVLEFIIAYKSEHDGVSPSFREIGEACGMVSTSTVAYYLASLRADGILDFQDGVPRSIEVMSGRWLLQSEIDRWGNLFHEAVTENASLEVAGKIAEYLNIHSMEADDEGVDSGTGKEIEGDWERAQ